MNKVNTSGAISAPAISLTSAPGIRLTWRASLEGDDGDFSVAESSAVLHVGSGFEAPVDPAALAHFLNTVQDAIPSLVEDPDVARFRTDYEAQVDFGNFTLVVQTADAGKVRLIAESATTPATRHASEISFVEFRSWGASVETTLRTIRVCEEEEIRYRKRRKFR